MTTTRTTQDDLEHELAALDSTLQAFHDLAGDQAPAWLAALLAINERIEAAFNAHAQATHAREAT